MALFATGLGAAAAAALTVVLVGARRYLVD